MDVTSFGIDHNLLKRGIFVSRVDEVGGDFVTSFDIRMKEPNREPVMETSVMHTLEHIIAVFFRTHPTWDKKTIYIGPMGCRTGMYFLFKGKLEPLDVLDIIRESFVHVLNSTEIPAYEAVACGNYLDNNLELSKIESKKFLDEVLNNMTEENMIYPRQDKKPV